MAAANKTQPTRVDPRDFVASVEHPLRRRDAETLLELFEGATGQPPTMWGPSIIGFGSYHYRYDSGREGDFLRVGFAPRKANLALYGLSAAPGSEALLGRLGKHKRGVDCVYVNKLADVDMGVLRELVGAAYRSAR
jgi:hypothetical protein